MGIQYRKRLKLGPGLFGNVSRRGVSVSKRVGRVSVNSRGRVSVRLLPGLFWRGRF